MKFNNAKFVEVLKTVFLVEWILIGIALLFMLVYGAINMGRFAQEMGEFRQFSTGAFQQVDSSDRENFREMMREFGGWASEFRYKNNQRDVTVTPQPSKSL